MNTFNTRLSQPHAHPLQNRLSQIPESLLKHPTIVLQVSGLHCSKPSFIVDSYPSVYQSDISSISTPPQRGLDILQVSPFTAAPSQDSCCDPPKNSSIPASRPQKKGETEEGNESGKERRSHHICRSLQWCFSRQVCCVCTSCCPRNVMLFAMTFPVTFTPDASHPAQIVAVSWQSAKYRKMVYTYSLLFSSLYFEYSCLRYSGIGHCSSFEDDGYHLVEALIFPIVGNCWSLDNLSNIFFRAKSNGSSTPAGPLSC